MTFTTLVITNVQRQNVETNSPLKELSFYQDSCINWSYKRAKNKVSPQDIAVKSTSKILIKWLLNFGRRGDLGKTNILKSKPKESN